MSPSCIKLRTLHHYYLTEYQDVWTIADSCVSGSDIPAGSMCEMLGLPVALLRLVFTRLLPAAESAVDLGACSDITGQPVINKRATWQFILLES